MPDYFEANQLLDLYQGLLTARQSQICEMHYREDLSLHEIAQELEISKAAVSDCLKKSLNQLEHYERRLHLLETRRKIDSLIRRYPQLRDELESLL